MNAFDRYFHAPFAAARPYLFSRLFLVMVALDTWTLMIGHASRYGVDGFNVAHFAWLDAILPQPSAALYVAVLLTTGLLALALTISVTNRGALAALFALYTMSWAMSMLDSYQHHYFVSSVLLCLVFFPQVGAADIHAYERPQPEASKPAAKKAKRKATATNTSHAPALTQGFGWNLLGATAGILYTYTSIAKMDAGWRDGHTITRISAAKRVYAPLVDLAKHFGIDDDQFWSLFATSVIPIELTIALTYLVSVRADSSESRWPKRIALLGWVLAMMLHVGAEAMDLEIGWFSYYMMLFACAFLLPARAVDTLAHALTWPASFVRNQLADILQPAEPASVRAGTLAIAAAVAVMLGLVGMQLDLPGAVPGCITAAAVLAVAVIVASVRGKAVEARPLVLGTGAAAALMWLAIANSEVRWDYYRFLGGDLKRRGEPAAALEAYERGERYAPHGKTRRDEIDSLRKQLETRGR